MIPFPSSKRACLVQRNDISWWTGQLVSYHQLILSFRINSDSTVLEDPMSMLQSSNGFRSQQTGLVDKIWFISLSILLYKLRFKPRVNRHFLCLCSFESTFLYVFLTLSPSFSCNSMPDSDCRDSRFSGLFIFLCFKFIFVSHMQKNIFVRKLAHSNLINISQQTGYLFKLASPPYHALKPYSRQFARKIL